MDNESRRRFLKRLAKGTLYSAPVIATMAAPVHLVGQGMSASAKGGMGGGAVGGGGGGGGHKPAAQFQGPWDTNAPPGRRP